MIDLKDAKWKYHLHKNSAKQRGIPFLLTFDKWLELWVSSGHWEERGKDKIKGSPKTPNWRIVTYSVTLPPRFVSMLVSMLAIAG